MRRTHLPIAALALLLAAPSQAALIQVTLTGLTENTDVVSGDPCGTGLGVGACNGQAMQISIQINTDEAPADSNAAADLGQYSKPIPPGFLAATATINGRVFTLPVEASVNHTVDLYDDLNTGPFGVRDRVQFGMVGANAGGTVTFTATPNVVMTPGAFTGDALELLASIAGSPLLFSGSTSLSFGSFDFSNASGQVAGLFRLSQVEFSPVPAPPALWLLGTAVAGLAARRWQRRVIRA